MRMSLSEALMLARVERDRGNPAAIATVVSSTVPAIAVGTRAVFTAGSIRAGSLGCELNRALCLDSHDLLAYRESALYSYVVLGTSAERVRAGKGDVDVFVEVHVEPPQLVVVGAGHIAVPLAAMAKIAGYEITVVDDRPEFANRERFPDADRILIGPYREMVAKLPMNNSTFVVLVTRGHVHDQACLEELLPTGAAYIGMIGSKRRVRTVAKHAVDQGASPERVRAIHAPVGLDLGARTPAEIAVAILAEMIAVRRGKHVRSLSLGEHIGV